MQSVAARITKQFLPQDNAEATAAGGPAGMVSTEDDDTIGRETIGEDDALSPNFPGMTITDRVSMVGDFALEYGITSYIH